MPLSRSLTARLERAAREASRHSYSVYSRFAVGASILTRSGKIFSGCNVENASYGLTTCAERIAIFNAVSRGHRSVLAVFVYVPGEAPATPCGACRQVIREFGPDALIVSFCRGSARVESSLDQLLPRSFGPDALAGRRPAGARTRGRRR